MSEKLRINWILARSTLAGGVKSNRLIAEAMQRRGHTVSIAYLKNGYSWPSPLRIRQFYRRLILQWKLWRGRPHHLEHSTVPLIPVDGLRVKQDDVPDADIVIGTWWETMEWIKDWPGEKGIKAYFIRHNETLISRHPDRVRETYRLPCVKLVIARWLAKMLEEEFNDPSAILIPNGVDRKQFDSTPRNKNTIPTVGLLHGKAEWKGVRTAFAALRLVQEKLPQTRVVCFGPRMPDGEELPANFEFHLHPEQKLIADLYRSTDCWLVPSTTEGFGMPGLEAAACHCPLVVTRSGGPEDYLREGINGYLTDVGDPEQMAENLIRVLMLDEAHWKMMSEASYSISKEFDWDRSAELLEEALLQAIESHKHKSDMTIAVGA